MSKWINKKLFQEFQEEKENEKDKPESGGGDFSKYAKWKNPEAGPVDKNKTYEIRFLPDKTGNFYKKYYYHGFYTEEKKFKYFLCPKTFDMEAYCPCCDLSSKLWLGSANDKKEAKTFSKKDRFVGNIFVMSDPRDVDQQDDAKKFSNKGFLYEFPSKIESKLKEQITDKKNGLGVDIFDPGKDGRTFIIKVKSTKQDENKKSWPDYSDSQFAPKSSPLFEDEAQIDAVMENTVILKEYLDSINSNVDDMVAAIKSMFMFDYIADNYARRFPDKVEKIPAKKEEVPSQREDKPAPAPKEEPKEEVKAEENEADEDLDFLDQLTNLGKK